MAETYTDEYGVVFSADRKTMLKAPNNLKEYSVPDGTQHIGNKAFKDCESLQEIVIPESVQKIESDAFSGCKNIKHAIIYGLKKYIGGFIFEDSTQVDIIVDGKPLLKGTVLQSRGRYECVVYEGHVYKGEPNGFGKRTLETMSGTEYLDSGYYYDGKFVTGPGFDEKGRRHGDGYFHGLTDEEFDEIWHDCN